MIRNTKVFGIAFGAVVAISMAASTAAQAMELHVGAGPSATITGTQTFTWQNNFKLTVSGAETKCSNAQFEGTVQGGQKFPATTTAQELTVTPTYSGCLTAGLSSQIVMNGCKYTITGVHFFTFSKTAWLDFTGCTSGKSIEIKLTGCTVTVPQQTGLSHLTFSDVFNEVEASLTVQGFTYELHGVACPKPINGQAVEVTKLTHDGDYTGGIRFKAFTDFGTGLQLQHNHQYTYSIPETQVSLSVT